MHFATYSIVCLLLMGVFTSPSQAQSRLFGVNLAGADFGEHNLPGQYNRDYTYPTRAEVDHFTALGMNVFRLPFRWERLQQTAFADFNAAELARLDAFVDYATTAGAHVILDPHNYARYYGDVIGSPNVPVEAFRDFWSRLATHYASNETVIFGLMNEPHSMSTELWLANANEAIDAIRMSGASNLILVPGNAWTGAHSWYQNWYGTPNATVMQGIVDPLNTYAIDLHQYLDADFSGTSPTCVSPTIGSEKLIDVTNWLKEQGLQGFLGEFGAADNTTCLQALDDMLDYIDANPEAWLGWTYWAAGPWWGNYMFSIEPDAQGNDAPQTAVLLKHVALLSNTDPAVHDAMPHDVLLQQNYPNPFNRATSIAFVLPHPSAVRLAVYNVLGQEIALLESGTFPAGHFETVWDARALPDGVYLYRLEAGTYTETKRLILHK